MPFALRIMLSVNGQNAEVGSNELHLLRYIYLSTFFG